MSTISQASTTFRHGESAIQIHLTLAGILAASLGYRDKVVELPEGATIRILLDSIDLPVSQRWTVAVVRGAVQDKRTVLHDGDQVFVAPVGGGG